MIVDPNFREILRRSKFDEHINFGLGIVEHLRYPVQKIPQLTNSWNNYLEAIRKETLMYNVWTENDGTPEIEAAHKVRDLAFRKVRRMMRYCVISRGPEVCKAALALLAFTPPLNASWHRKADEETLVIGKFLKKCRSRAQADNVIMIGGLKEALAELTVKNVYVGQLCKLREEAGAEVKSFGRIIDVRFRTDDILMDFFKTVNALEYYFATQSRTRTVKQILESIGPRVAVQVEKLRVMVNERAEQRMAKRKGER